MCALRARFLHQSLRSLTRKARPGARAQQRFAPLLRAELAVFTAISPFGRPKKVFLSTGFGANSYRGIP